MSQQESDEYVQSKLVYSELKSARDTSKEEGQEQGIEIGKEQGIEIGIPKGEIIKARKIGKEIKSRGFLIEVIAELTNLSKEEIEKL